MESTLSPSPSELRLEELRITPGRIFITATAKRRFGRCPSCGEPSQRVHSRYKSRIADLLWHGVPVEVELVSRKFFCGTLAASTRSSPSGCRRRYAAKANKPNGYPPRTSGDILLRRLKRPAATIADIPTPRYLGVDEWAWRKGRTYGTLLCDLERGTIVDLLPERSAESLAEWLRTHPGIKVISRDRSPIYAEGARLGAPDAIEVADRWHLFRNLTDALQKILQRQHARLHRAAMEAARRTAPAPEAKESMPPATEQRKQANRARRLARYEEVVDLKAKGWSHSAIARRVAIERRTVLRWLQHDGFPERKERAPRKRPLDPILLYLRQRWSEWVTNAALLFRKIQSQGYRGTSSSQLRDLIAGWRIGGPPPVALSRVLSSVRQSAWMLVLPEEKRTPEHRALLAELTGQWPEIQELERLAREFVRLFQEHDPQSLGAWLDAADKTPLRGFARGLFSDLRAVRAAMTLPWSNGPTEGHINRLKMVKRQVYGRAGFQLLRARVLAA